MASPDPGAVSIGSLRWPVTIATRTQAAADGGGLQETLTELQTVMADIQPTGALTFYSGVQVDTPITHKIRIRWLDWIDTTHVVIRNTTRLDGSTRQEMFRVRRVKEIDGRKRFAELEVEEEKRT